MRGDGFIERFLELLSLAIPKFKEILRLPAGFRSVPLDTVAFEPCISADALTVEGQFIKSVERGKLADKLLEPAVLTTVVRANRPEVDRLWNHRRDLDSVVDIDLPYHYDAHQNSEVLAALRWYCLGGMVAAVTGCGGLHSAIRVHPDTAPHPRREDDLRAVRRSLDAARG